MEKIAFDAKGKVFGRLASRASIYLMGKHKPNFLPYKKDKILVEVKNIDDIRLTSKLQAIRRHSHYLGHLNERTLSVKERFRHAVWMMLPKNKQRRKLIKNLVLYDKE